MKEQSEPFISEVQLIIGRKPDKLRWKCFGSLPPFDKFCNEILDLDEIQRSLRSRP